MKLKVDIDVSMPTWLKRAMLVAIVPVSIVAFAGVVSAGGTTDFKDGETLSAAKLNAAFASIDARLTKAEGQSPPGTIIAYSGATAPEGWLPCDGTQLDSSKAEYQALYAAIGTTYGGNSTSGVFNLPDLRGRFLRGWDNQKGNDPDAANRAALNPGGNTGDKIGTLQSGAVGPHSHKYYTISGSGSIDDSSFTSGAGTSYQYTDSDTGGKETRPVNVSINWLIKL